VTAFERALGRPIEQHGVPADQPIPGVPEQIHALLASLDIYDSPMDISETAKAFGVRLTSVADYARQMAEARVT
jgi:hypothetical protein